ncbi:tyrosine-type recombinase/integrase [Lactococcus petauri]|uniref:tyrosine-type recombinase/integrase n=1 Tax=Lactococcus petauri TaxID=1940789 RepID=UPI002078937B|nr:tyrosine-type recombinase/integrase [Lactococcus petauri]USI65351.1 tyrosine-type recombinase/integrase [Lactococcus petauri]USI67846.1 tyrosine-type recombinase/integrase [Lactococcus petauri]WJE12507.1 tyrosine-type recombinase/integrase [Lactococcus petauri]
MQKFIEQFIQEKKLENLSQLTITSYQTDLRIFGNFCYQNNLDMSNGINEYLKYLEETPDYLSSTKSRKLVTLKLFHRYLVQNQFIDKNTIFPIKIRKEKRLPKTLPLKELQKLVEVVEIVPNSPVKIRDQIRNCAIMTLLISLGLRICEIKNLNLQDYQPKEGRITIFGKNKKERILFITNSQDKLILKNYLKTRKQYNPKNKEPAFFLNKYGKRFSIYGIENIYFKYRDMANIAKNSTPHHLRHTFATELLNNGASIRDIQELLGHSSITTTEIYVEVSSKRKKRVLSKFGVQKYK